MTTVAFLLDAVSGSPSNTGASVRQAHSFLFPGATSARPLGSLSGVRAGTPTDTITVSGSTVTIKPHSGVLDKHTAATTAPYLYAVTANETKTLDAAHATNARIDIITVKVDDPSTSDGSTVPAVTIQYKAGTPAASPVAPTPDTTREMVLANINVPASGGGSATVTWKAPTVTAPGAPYYWLSQAQQDAQTGMVAGEFGLQANNGITYQYSGSAWQAWSSDWIAFTPTLTNIAIGTGGGAENTAYYRYANGSGEVKGIIKLGTSGASVGTLPTLTLPSGWAAVKPFETAVVCGSLSILDSSTPSSTASGQIGFVSGSTSTIRFLRQPDSLGVIQPITASSPFTFASGDIFAYRYTVDLS